MREFDTNTNGGGVQEATGPNDAGADGFNEVSTRRYTVAPDEPIDVAIVYAVAATAGVDPLELDRPLQDAVDADALRQLFASADETMRATVVVDEYEISIVEGGSELIVTRR